MIFSFLFSRSVKQFAGLLPVIAMGAVTLFLPVNVGASVTVGSSVTLYATADGSPAPTFQWKKNGANLPGATGAIYSIAVASLADSGAYRVTATNVAGSAESADEVLSVTEASVVNPPPPTTNPPPPTTNPPPPPTNSGAPLFTTQPVASQAAATGMTVNLVVAASGTPAPTYQWQKNGIVFAGATNPTLTLVSVTTNDNATYTAVATNSSGSVTSSPALLTVTPPNVAPPPPPTLVDVVPSITSQPTSSQTVAPGATVTLTVVATATPTPTFQWLKNDLAVPGATNATLVLTGVAAADMGSYVVTVSNSVGFVVSNPAVLTVSDLVVTPPPVTPPPGTSPAVAPTITSQPVASQSILAGAEVTLSVGVSGSPAPSIQWRKNGISIIGATGASLVLRNTTAIDAATYSVRATNSAGSVLSANAVLVVGVKPVFSMEPESQAIYLGSRVILRAVAVGMPTPALQWYKNGTAIPSATLATLLLNVTTTADLATYYVTATNFLGTASSREATIVIAAPPIITAQPTSQTVAAKSNVTFSVGATGSPAPTYQWMKNGVNILGATNSKLTLFNVGLSDEGTYSVEAINTVGWVPSNRVTLNVSAAVEQKQTDGGATSPSDPVAGVDPATVSRIVNLSVRSRAGSGNSGLIVGFVIGGSATKPMLVRGVGPTLRNFGVPDALSDPALSLYSGAVMTASNDDWAKGGNMSQIVATSARLGAFTLPDASVDSALLANLDTGAYTVQVNGKDTATGVALVEVYDAAAANPASLVNLSVRTHVGSGADAPNVGFVVSGTEARRVLIRAVGPTLAAFGVSDLLADPQLEIFKGGVLLDSNDNWGGDPAHSAIFARVGAFSFTDGKSRDAVLLVTLQPGAYTVIASGVSGTTGIALVEVYDVP